MVQFDKQKLVGKIINRFLVIEYGYHNKNGHYWKCQCKCGTIKYTNHHKLTQSGTKSCGCYTKERGSPMKTHGMSKTRFYGIWNDMMMRCYNKNKERYPNYGGRGIRVSERWHTFMNFYTDLFKSYSKGLSLERKDVNGDYCQSNCCWIPMIEQKLNKTTTKRLRIDGVTKGVKEWSNISGQKEFTIYVRLRKGWPHKDAVYGRGFPCYKNATKS